MRAKEIKPSRQTLCALDAVNFLMTDVYAGFGPVLAIYLAASLHWNPRDTGVAAFALGIFWFFMPETGQKSSTGRGSDPPSAAQAA